jgi:chromobox protein 1
MPDEVPAKGKGKAPAKAANIEEGDDEDSEEEEEEDEYQVEKILSHSFQTNRGKTKVIYEIKWLGYEDEADQTWEPIENLYDM